MTPSKWATMYRMMGEPFPGKFSFKYHPWLLEMHDAEEDIIVGQKGAQLGFTEWALNVTFYHMDILNHSVLYVLPTQSDATDFTASRFNPALEMSPHLRAFFNEVNNVGLKRAGSTTLFVRGSHSRSKLKSIPTPVVILDEVDEMPKSSLALVQERQSGQRITKTLKLSTPTYPGQGINEDFELSTQDDYFFRCPSCNKYITFEPKRSLIITAETLNDPRIADSHYICLECKNKLPHEDKHIYLKPKRLGGTGEFIKRHSQRTVRGFHINQYYSSAKVGRPEEQAVAHLKAATDETAAQELYNSKFGLPYEPKGAKVSREQIYSCKNLPVTKRTVGCGIIRTLGIDVGSVLHFVIKEWYNVGGHPGLTINERWVPKIIVAGTTEGGESDFLAMERLFQEMKCVSCVVDSEPERRAALQFAQRLYGKVYLCDYQTGQSGRELKVDEDELSVKVNRTAWMDLTLGRYKSKRVSIEPKVLSETFVNQVTTPLRILQIDKWGNPYAVYINNGPDHYAHADVYSEIAFALAKFDIG